MAASNQRRGMGSVASLFSARATEQRHCEDHGDYESNLYRVPSQPPREIWSPCPHCERERVQAEDRAIVAEAQRARHQARMEQLIGRAAIPPRFQDRTLESYTAEYPGQVKALNASRRYVEGFADHRARGRCLIFCGNAGTGKTHLIVGIIKGIMAAGYTGTYTRMLELARAVKETYGHDAPRTEREVYEEFARPDLLVIDEVGRQHGSDTERMVLFEVINARYELGKPTILCANRSLSQLRDYLDEAAEDRMREGGGRVVVFDWDSHRRNV